ncbi:DUF1330 domain-containing protein [Pseudemcibacter aquimaris]|uniref:DUF1330 domain-containing protein n=1 Tax=Pseudemcibacter aquimaris TaxID=2857064 RepID=UPI002013186A|nr:DUF1330 domain-containing protein [Pseudemcibacter aquimaris]MCC3861479.1 DUF1330 domain-containing protein [Pseudemcibacter aquimaris]WDU58248.1 DUF1330 domain-containing protein [Pseudemcibacter aquimaris]
MTAYFVARFKIKDAGALASYSQEAGPIIKSFGGELLFKGGADQILTGEITLPNIAVFQFPDQSQLDAFYNSDDYKALKIAREKGAEMVLSAHQ